MPGTAIAATPIVLVVVLVLVIGTVEIEDADENEDGKTTDYRVRSNASRQNRSLCVASSTSACWSAGGLFQAGSLKQRF